MLVAACKAPNGTYWAVQAWQRRLPLLGFEPWLPHHSNWELHLSHFSGELPKLEVYPNWTYQGRWQGVFGRYTYLGQPIYGFGANAKGVPKDKYGRNLYIDTLNSSYGAGWKRESGILTHKGTGTFCHSFVPQRPFAGYPEPGGAACSTWRASPDHGRRPGCDARDAGRARWSHEGRSAARRRVQLDLRPGDVRRPDLRGRALADREAADALDGLVADLDALDAGAARAYVAERDELFDH